MTRTRSRAGRGAAGLGAVLTLLLLLTAAPAAGQEGTTTPPPLGDTAPPDVQAPRAGDATQSMACLAPSPPSASRAEPLASPAQAQLGYSGAWANGTGEGVTVAVIDTGVNPSSRLTLVPGGDYVADGGDGTSDCEGHGSVVAGIIAAHASPSEDTYVGVAPGATILSIRQYSSRFRASSTGGDAQAQVQDGFGDLASLARAVVWAASSGAEVINISEAACAPAGSVLVGDAQLGAALRYAVDVRDAVVVVAAGNQGQACASSNDPLGLAAPTTIASPAWWDDYVLTVGAVDPDGAPSGFSIDGPWVDVAAPGTDIVGLNPVAGPSVINILDGQAIEGTSFAAPYVAGTVALVRQRFPALSARQVMARVEATAHAPAGGRDDRVGYGVVDPVAAVDDVPDVLTPAPAATASAPIAAPARPTPASTTPRTVALVGSAAALVALVVAHAGVDAVRRARRNRPSRVAG